MTAMVIGTLRPRRDLERQLQRHRQQHRNRMAAHNKHESHKHESVTPAPQETDAKKETLGNKIKLVVDIVQAILTIFAICAGGWWFLKQESVKPQVKLEQTITQRPLGNDPSEVLLTVEVRATNMGKTKVELSNGQMEVSQINPVPGGSLATSPLQALILEPGESDQALFKSILIYKSTLTIEVHSEYSVPGTKNVWNLLSAVDIGETPTKKETASINQH